MTKSFILLVTCLLVACSSRQSSGLRDFHFMDTVAGTPQKDEGKSLDTAMVSLRTGKAVALTDALCQRWKLENVDEAHWNEIFWDSSGARQFPELAIFKDATVTENSRSGIRTGQWLLNRETKELRMSFTDGTQKTYFIRQVALRQMMLYRIRGGDTASLGFSADGLTHKRPAEDPFYPANNLWRIRPEKAETGEQIHSRLKGYIHFYSLFFHDNRLRQAMEIHFSGLPECLVWYNGGIGMPEKEGMDEKWINCFYSKDQAMEGYAILESILAKHDLKWPEHPTSWIKEIYEVLDQIYDKL